MIVATIQFPTISSVIYLEIDLKINLLKKFDLIRSRAMRNVVFLYILLFCIRACAQQLPQFTQYMFNTASINPAYAGSRQTLNITALHRNQWAGIEANPVTSTFSMHTPSKNEKIGLGLSYIADQLGTVSTNFIYGDFSYSIPISWKTKLSFGLKAGFTSYTKDYSTSTEERDPLDLNVNSWRPNFGAGIYMSSNKWFVGISSPRILNNGPDLSGGDLTTIIDRNSYYAIGGFVINISPNIKFRPTAISKFTNGAPASYDTTASFLFYEKLWMGTSYRFNNADSFGFFLDYQVMKHFRIGYAYDLPTNEFKMYSGGTHEVILIFEPTAIFKTRVYKSPRYF